MHFPYLQLFISTLAILPLVHTKPTLYKSRSDVVDCLTSQNVRYAVKGSANWTSLSTPYNLRLIYEPAVITIPETPDHVSASVTCAAAVSLKVQAKGGGHSYASYSSGGQNGSLIIDMENFSSIEVDQSECLQLLNVFGSPAIDRKVQVHS
jgi:FAD/FMN-containing dehydrogenase